MDKPKPTADLWLRSRDFRTRQEAEDYLSSHVCPCCGSDEMFFNHAGVMKCAECLDFLYE